MKTETCKLYSRLLNISEKIIKFDLYNSELYCFKVGAFFETHCRKSFVEYLTDIYKTLTVRLYLRFIS